MALLPQQFGLDMFSITFDAVVNGIDILPKSVWIGEMSITGVVPDNETINNGTSRPYTF
jgi:hypothetical protein